MRVLVGQVGMQCPSLKVDSDAIKLVPKSVSPRKKLNLALAERTLSRAQYMCIDGSNGRPEEFRNWQSMKVTALRKETVYQMECYMYM
jgi:hypothetical protein